MKSHFRNLELELLQISNASPGTGPSTKPNAQRALRRLAPAHTPRCSKISVAAALRSEVTLPPTLLHQSKCYENAVRGEHRAGLY